MYKRQIQGLRDKGVTLMITVDCGITGNEEIDFAASIGMDVVEMCIRDRRNPVLLPGQGDESPLLKDRQGQRGPEKTVAAAYLRRQDVYKRQARGRPAVEKVSKKL